MILYFDTMNRRTRVFLGMLGFVVALASAALLMLGRAPNPRVSASVTVEAGRFKAP